MGNFKFDKEVLKKLFAEFTGTAMVLTLGCCLAPDPELSRANYSLGWGLTYMAVIHVFAFMSGAHLNPAISGAATIMGVMGWELMLCYMLSQLLGAILGMTLAWSVTLHESDVCNLFAKDEIEVLCVEFFASMLLVFAYCSAWDNRTDGAYETISLRIGFIFAALSFATSRFSGCSLNFFRTLASTVVNSTWKMLWPYFVSNLTACCLVACLWRFLIAESQPSPMD